MISRRAKFTPYRSHHCIALLATAMIAVALPVGANAQTPAPAAAPGQVRFDVAPQPLDTALTSVADQGGVRIFFTSAELTGTRSNGVSGAMTVEEALSRVLTGTGFTWRFQADRTVAIERAPQVQGAMQLGPVRVEGSGADGSGSYPAPPTSVTGTLPQTYPGGKVARGAQLGLLGNQDVFDTPFSVSSYTAETARDLGARTPLQVLVLDPSITRATGGTESSDQFIVRGFTAFGYLYTVNGLLSLGGTFGFDAEAYERIELLKGPAALLNGGAASANVGGTVNLVTKKATDDPISHITAQLTSGAEGLVALDFGRRIGPEGEFGIRTNLVYSDGTRNVAAKPHFRRIMGTVDLDYRGHNVRAYVHGSVLERFTSPSATILGPSLLPFDPTKEPEPRRVCRRLFGLSHAAIGRCSIMA